MKTLYEILEVSQTASKEVIEKAYKTLVKKYHPDLQSEEDKKQAEKTMKQLNEAYEILSDDEKRKEYDQTLEEARKQEEQYKQSQEQVSQEELRKENHKTKEEIRKSKQMEREIQKNMQAEYEARYQNAYENYLRSLGYKIKYKWTWKNYRDFFITIAIIIGICAILWFFPLTHNWLVEFYESNQIIKTIVDIIWSILVGIWNAITSLFEG